MSVSDIYVSGRYFTTTAVVAVMNTNGTATNHRRFHAIRRMSSGLCCLPGITCGSPSSDDRQPRRDADSDGLPIQAERNRDRDCLVESIVIEDVLRVDGKKRVDGDQKPARRGVG